MRVATAEYLHTFRQTNKRWEINRVSNRNAVNRTPIRRLPIVFLFWKHVRVFGGVPTFWQNLSLGPSGYRVHGVFLLQPRLGTRTVFDSSKASIHLYDYCVDLNSITRLNSGSSAVITPLWFHTMFLVQACRREKDLRSTKHRTDTRNLKCSNYRKYKGNSKSILRLFVV